MRNLARRKKKKRQFIKVARISAGVFWVAAIMAGCTTDDDGELRAGNPTPMYDNPKLSGMPADWIRSAEAPVIQDFSGATDSPPSETAPAPVYSRPAAPRDLAYGTPVPARPGLVVSPYYADGYVDVKGHPPETMVKCPYTGKVFLVP